MNSIFKVRILSVFIGTFDAILFGNNAFGYSLHKIAPNFLYEIHLLSPLLKLNSRYLCKRRYFFLATSFCFGETKERFLLETIAFG